MNTTVISDWLKDNYNLCAERISNMSAIHIRDISTHELRYVIPGSEMSMCKTIDDVRNLISIYVA